MGGCIFYGVIFAFPAIGDVVWYVLTLGGCGRIELAISAIWIAAGSTSLSSYFSGYVCSVLLFFTVLPAFLFFRPGLAESRGMYVVEK